MANIPPVFPFLLVAASSAWAVYISYAYFFRIQYANRQSAKLQIFIIITSLNLLLACLLLSQEITAYYELEIMYVFPVEHIFSAQKVGLAYGVALVGSLVAWKLIHHASTSTYLPSLTLILPLSIAAVFCGLFSIYISTIGFCCESPLSVFAGFPFSVAHGVYGWEYSAYQAISQMSLAGIFQQYGSAIHWLPDIPAIFANLLFWMIVFYLLIIPIQYLMTRTPSTSKLKNLDIRQL